MATKRIDTSNRLPHCLDAHQYADMAHYCPRELTAWRNAVAYHASLPSVSRKLDNRRNLECSYERLMSAWAIALRSMELAECGAA